MRTLIPTVVLFATAGLTGCAADSQSSPPQDDTPAADHEEPRHGEPAHWSYGDGDDGPAHWGDLDDAYSLCADGSHQSPVDLPAAPPAGDQVVIDVGDADGVVADTGHTFQFTVGDGGGTSLTFDDEEYDLVQMHYHVPSEHTVEGYPADVEFHFVHQSADGGLLVLGLMAEEGAENPGAQPFIDAVDDDEDETDTGLDLSAILPDDSAAYSYEGSLTTPACSEGVHWLVLEERIELSPEQLAVLTAAEDHNARPTQPLSDREIDGAHLDFVEK
jgi:carbonic anhydrase